MVLFLPEHDNILLKFVLKRKIRQIKFIVQMCHNRVKIMFLSFYCSIHGYTSYFKDFFRRSAHRKFWQNSVQIICLFHFERFAQRYYLQQGFSIKLDMN